MEWIPETPREKMLLDWLRMVVLETAGGRIVLDEEDYHESLKYRLEIGGETEITIATYPHTLHQMGS